jgi:PadR family transcriptional regulator, regulatory protein PadR
VSFSVSELRWKPRVKSCSRSFHPASLIPTVRKQDGFIIQTEAMDDFFDNWTVQVRKGLLELCILNALADEERYGYDLVKTLIEVHGLGVTEGTIYPLLSRLRVAGLVASRLEESSAGPARKYYSLTKEGRKTMETMNTYMTELNRSATRLRKRSVV